MIQEGKFIPTKERDFIAGALTYEHLVVQNCYATVKLERR
jgi:hypothetical protein